MTDGLCAHCGGEIAIRNPTGNCDHLHWPDMLSYEAKLANGYTLKAQFVWVKEPVPPVEGE